MFVRGREERAGPTGGRASLTHGLEKVTLKCRSCECCHCWRPLRAGQECQPTCESAGNCMGRLAWPQHASCQAHRVGRTQLRPAFQTIRKSTTPRLPGERYTLPAKRRKRSRPTSKKVQSFPSTREFGCSLQS